MSSKFGAAILSVAATLAATPAFAADGAKVYGMYCKVCHEGGLAGPSLVGIVGSKAGSRPDFRYSEGLKRKGGTWTEANLSEFLQAPTKFAPGTRMTVSVPNPDNRAAIIAYLKELR